MTTSKVVGSVSKESLCHFRCGVCGLWWSIGDPKGHKSLHCPWCGIKQSFKVLPKSTPTSRS